MQTIYKVSDQYFGNLQQAMDFAENRTKRHSPEGASGAWRKAKNGISYVAKWYYGSGKNASFSSTVIFIEMERHAVWKNIK